MERYFFVPLHLDFSQKCIKLTIIKERNYMNKFISTLLLILCYVPTIYGQQFSSIIGKDIFLANGCNSIGVVYMDKTDKKGNLVVNKKNIYPNNIFGKRIHVLDAVTDSTAKLSNGQGVFRVDFMYQGEKLHLVMPLYLKKDKGYVKYLYKQFEGKSFMYKLLGPIVYFGADIDRLDSLAGKRRFVVRHHNKKNNKISFYQSGVFPKITETDNGLVFSDGFKINNYYIYPFDGVLKKVDPNLPSFQEYMDRSFTFNDALPYFLQNADTTKIDSIRTAYENKEVYYWNNKYSPQKFMVARIRPEIHFPNYTQNEFDYEYRVNLHGVGDNKRFEYISLDVFLENSQLATDYEAYKKQQELSHQKEQAERLEKLTKKYGKKYAKDILDRHVRIGMTDEMVLEAIGEPLHINSTVTKYSYDEQWVYKYKYIYFENGRVTTIQYND